MNEKNLIQHSDRNNNYLFCPSNNCFNIPDISYAYNPLISNIQYKCNCHNNRQSNNINLLEFLKKSSKIECSECKLNITENKKFYCKQCKKILDYSCYEQHIQVYTHEVFLIDINYLSNYCLEHYNCLMFHCQECNKSLCCNCDLNYHNNKGHNLIQIRNCSSNQNDKERIYFTFQKQKYFLEKIKKINQTIIQSLESDIILKQKIIENNKNNKCNFHSIFNYNNLYIQNDFQFDKLIEYIINKEEELENNPSSLDKEAFLNRMLAPLYYTLMINSNKNLNKELLNLLKSLIDNLNKKKEEKIIIKNNCKNNNDVKVINNNIHYIYDKKENDIKDNNYINIENNRNNNNFNISFDYSNQFYNISNPIKNEKNFKEKINISNEIKGDNNMNSQKNLINNKLILKGCIKNDYKHIKNFKVNILNCNKNINFVEEDKSKKSNNNENNYLNKNDNKLKFNNLVINSNISNNSNLNKSIIIHNNNINKIINNLNISKNNNLNNINSQSSLINNKKELTNDNLNNRSLNNSNNYSSDNLYNSNNTNSKNEKSYQKSKNISDIHNEKRKSKKEERISLSEKNLKNQKEKEGTSKNNINNSIYNMIILYSGNFALSMKEAIEIYDFRKLDLSTNLSKVYNDKEIKENNCLLQRINLVKNKKINYVFEFPDKTLLCGTYSKIFRLKLTNNDLSHNILGIIKLQVSELPTQLISLGDSLLIVLSEQKNYCNLKIFKKYDNGEYKINEEKKYDNMSSNQSSDNNESFLSDYDYSDVAPPIGNSLFAKKDINIDTSFQLLQKNINKEKKLLLSIYEIKKDNNNNEYLYEFIATSNKVYNLGDNRIEFYGAKKIGNGSLYFSKINIIRNISCSIQVNSICQLNNKYVCVGLQNHDLKGQISGFAIIDIYSRDICRIIRDHEISCIFCNRDKNILIASMEVRDIKNNYFMNKVYKICNSVGDKGKEDIDLKKIYEYKNGHGDTVSSVCEIKPFCIKVNTEQKNINENVIFVTSSHDSTLEVLKTDIKI